MHINCLQFVPGHDIFGRLRVGEVFAPLARGLLELFRTIRFG